MFCPKCKCEYREGFTKCSDCGISLVDELLIEVKPKNAKVEYIDLEFILSTLKYTDVALIKSIFEGEGITHYIQGEDMGVAPGGIPARVLVKKDQVDEAKTLLKKVNLM